MFDWNEVAVEKTRDLWKQGRSASEIASSLGGRISRNAVIGKLHRLGLTKSGRKPGYSPKRHKSDKENLKTIARRAWDGKRKRPLSEIMADRESGLWKRKAEQEKARQLAIAARFATGPDVARVSFMDLEPHHCRWPVGEPTQGFCGCDKVPGLSYCEHHAARAFATVAVARQTAWNVPVLGSAALRSVEEFLAEAVA